MSVNFLKSSLAYSLALLATWGIGTSAMADGPFGNLVLGPQNSSQQMPGQMQMQMGAPQMQMSGPPMQQNYQPQQQMGGYPTGPSGQYGGPQYSPAQNYGNPSIPQYAPQRPPMPQQYAPTQYAPGPQYCAPAMPQLPPVKIQVPAGSSPVDLSIDNLRFGEPGTVLVGPSYHVTVRNNGSEYAPRFHIGLFASLDGVVNEHSPKAFLEVRDLAPGTSVDYTVRLPVNADSIPDPRTGQIRPFTHVAAVVDVFRMQHEGDESNNTAMLPRQVVDNAE